MIKDSVIINEGGKTFKRLTRANDFWAVGYIGNQILEMTEEEDPITSGHVVDGNTVLSGFSADSWDEMAEEIENRNLNYPS